jgi:hypothetical protein
MTPFDRHDHERSRPSAATPRCVLCEEAALPAHGGYCFRHAFVGVSSSTARRANSPG